MVSPRVLLVASSAALAAAGSFTVSGEHAQFALHLASVIATVAGGIAWMDKRIDRRIREHAESERREDGLRHAAVMAEIGHLRREIGTRKK